MEIAGAALKLNPCVLVEPLEESIVQAYKDGNTINLEDYLEPSPMAVAILSGKKLCVHVEPLEESIVQAYKEGSTINVEDFPEPSSMAIGILSGKKPTMKSILICRQAARELQFLKYFEKLGWKSDDIMEYCRTSDTDIRTLMKQTKLLYLSLKECNINVDKIVQQYSKGQRNLKIFFEYLTQYLQCISTRKPVIVLERIDPQDVLKRKVQEILIPDQNKVAKVHIETVDDTDYREIKRPNRRKSCTRIREDSSVNKPFVLREPYRKKVSRKRDGLSKRSTRGTKNGMADKKYTLNTLNTKEKIPENALAVNNTVSDIIHSESVVGKENSTEDCNKNEVNTGKQDLKEIETGREDLEERILKECFDSLSGKSDECTESAKLYEEEISQIWSFSNISFEDMYKDLFSVDSQMLNSLSLRLESMDLNKIPVEKTTCPYFKANGYP